MRRPNPTALSIRRRLPFASVVGIAFALSACAPGPTGDPDAQLLADLMESAPDSTRILDFEDQPVDDFWIEPVAVRRTIVDCNPSHLIEGVTNCLLTVLEPVQDHPDGLVAVRAGYQLNIIRGENGEWMLADDVIYFVHSPIDRSEQESEQP